jgi:hypothetical protein
MRDWNLRPGDPLSLVLASDARLGPTDYINDQIWELSIGTGDPPALSLNTTYGLRAKAVRLFPRFGQGNETRSDPDGFTRPPEIRQIYPNFALLSFAPFEALDITFEIWIPHSHAIAGRIKVANNGRDERKIRAEMVGQLSSIDGQRLAPFEMEAVTLLCGFSAGLAPILFMTGGAKAGSGPYPSLSLTMQMMPGEQRQFTWVQSAQKDRETSFAMAREIASQNWEAEKSRIEMLNAGNVEIYSGDPGWDAAFMLSQKQAALLLAGPTSNLPSPSFVITRQPDQGYSLRGDGSDYNHLWNGQTVLEAYYLAGILLPVAPDAVKGLVRDFLAVQDPNGDIDWKPGLGGQRNQLLATPLLAGLIWRIYEQTEDIQFLEQSFEPVCRFVKAWFHEEHDRDRDGIPEWDNPLQSGVDNHPVYSRWPAASLGVDISKIESPSLCALLFHECESVRRIAAVLGKEAQADVFGDFAIRLQDAAEASWDNRSNCYLNWDRDTHFSTPGETILSAQGSGNHILRRDFEHPIRLLIQIRTDETVRRHPMIFVHGRSATGNARVERIDDDQFRWMPGTGQLTGKNVFSRLDRIEIHGLELEDQIQISSVDFHTLDLTLLAPLWAGMPDEDRAKKLVEETVTYPGLFWREYGLPICPQPYSTTDQQSCWTINLPWNALIGEGLIRYGYQSEAAELISRLLAPVVNSLRKDNAFRRGYHAETGLGQGEYNALNGLAPLGLFLDVLGVRLISSKRIRVSGFNPFPWPVTVKYRGMTVMKQKDRTVVIFPDGQTVTVTDAEPRLVSLEEQDQ